MQKITNQHANPEYAYKHPVYVNWATACLALLESGIDELTIEAMSAYAQHRAEVLGLAHDMPVEVERGWAPHNLISGKGRWDVVNSYANPETGRVDRFNIWLPSA